MSASVDVILPCLNEAAALPGVIAGLPAGYRAIVVDNGSTDGSADVARAAGATVVREEQKGYGAACHAGLTAATAEFVAFCDADGSLDLRELPGLAAPVLDGSADVAVGRRAPATRGAWPVHARIANRFLAWRIRRTTGVQLWDIGPVRVARREALIDLRVTDRRSGYPLETIVLAAGEGWRFTEMPMSYEPRVGKSKVTGTVRGTLTAVGDMSRVLARSGKRPVT